VARTAGADVFVENFRTGAMKRFGVDYETMAARNPKLIYCSLSGFGQTGMKRSAFRVSCATILVSQTGLGQRTEVEMDTVSHRSLRITGRFRLDRAGAKSIFPRFLAKTIICQDRPQTKTQEREQKTMFWDRQCQG
jgi:hypothetical protein